MIYEVRLLRLFCHYHEKSLEKIRKLFNLIALSLMEDYNTKAGKWVSVDVGADLCVCPSVAARPMRLP